MFKSRKILSALAAALAVSIVAGCAEKAPPPQYSAENGPELAGAWYQIYFDTNKFDINKRGQMIVDNVDSVVSNNEATRVTVIGKTDRVGSPAANMALSRRRADQVRDALVSAGVPDTLIDTSWTGEGKQEVATSDEEAEHRNRVVDITVMKLPR